MDIQTNAFYDEDILTIDRVENKKEEYTSELVISTLRELEGTFRILREQAVRQTGGLYQCVDANRRDQTVREVLDAYVSYLKESKVTEVEDFFFTEELYEKTLNSLEDGRTRRVLLSFYKVDEDTPWKEISGRMASYQNYKSKGFPSSEIVGDSLRWLSEHQKDNNSK